jgi:hypothetical protein
MQIEIFCLCKAVQTNALNQPTLIDIFDVKIAAGEPVLIEPFVVMASIRFYKTDFGMHRFKFELRDESGTVLVSSTEILSISEIPMGRDSFMWALQSHMGRAGLKFGRYDFSIESGGRRLANSPLYVIRGRV